MTCIADEQTRGAMSRKLMRLQNLRFGQDSVAWCPFADVPLL